MKLCKVFWRPIIIPGNLTMFHANFENWICKSFDFKIIRNMIFAADDVTILFSR